MGGGGETSEGTDAGGRGLGAVALGEVEAAQAQDCEIEPPFSWHLKSDTLPAGQLAEHCACRGRQGMRCHVTAALNHVRLPGVQ